MSKTKGAYNFLSFLFIISLIWLALDFKNALIPVIVYAIIYTVLVLILGFKKSEKKSYKISMVVGSILLVGIMPFIYYITYLKKVLKKEKQTSEIKNQLIEEMGLKKKPQNNSEKTNS